MSPPRPRWYAKPRLWFWGLRELSRLGRPDAAFAFLGGLGDELLCTTALVEWRRRHARNLWVMTFHPTLFSGLDCHARILTNDARYPRLCAALGREMRFVSYSRYDPETDRDVPPSRHIIAEICLRSGLTGKVHLRPYFHLDPQEIADAEPYRDSTVIQTSTLNAHVPMLNKQWPTARFQECVDRLSPSLKFVQLGSAGDPLLRNVVDLRGRTTLRQSAAILHAARLFLGPVGFLMHLSRAVDCPAVIVYGGRETPELTGYSCNENIVQRPVCSPCWQRSRCDFSRCYIESIPAETVATAVRTLLSRPRAPLAVMEAEL